MSVFDSRNSSTLPRVLGWVLVGLAAVQPTESSALVTSDAGLVASFQAGAAIESFDNLPALAITSYDNGQIVPAANLFSSRDLAAFTSPFFNSGNASFNNPVGNPGRPIGILAPGGAIAGDLKSASNVAGPLVGDLPGPFEAFNNGFMEVIFPADVSRVGFWITQGSNIQLIAKDSNNSNLAGGIVVGNAGQFVGVERASPDIRGVTIGFAQAFTLDDFTYAASAPIPEPASPLLLGMGLMALLGVARAGRGPALGRFRT
jgi:hypothetical protein